MKYVLAPIGAIVGLFVFSQFGDGLWLYLGAFLGSLAGTGLAVLLSCRPPVALPDEEKSDSREFVADHAVKQAHRRDIKSLIAKNFSRAEQLIITCYYYKEMSMAEIGRMLDLSEARVSEIHSSILQRLKERLDKGQKEFGLDEPSPD